MVCEKCKKDMSWYIIMSGHKVYCTTCLNVIPEESLTKLGDIINSYRKNDNKNNEEE